MKTCRTSSFLRRDAITHPPDYHPHTPMSFSALKVSLCCLTATATTLRLIADSHSTQLEQNKRRYHQLKEARPRPSRFQHETELERATRLTQEQEDDQHILRADLPWAPRPIFHKNVDASAWGLAIHTEARLIAASANSRKCCKSRVNAPWYF